MMMLARLARAWRLPTGWIPTAALGAAIVAALAAALAQ